MVDRDRETLPPRDPELVRRADEVAKLVPALQQIAAVLEDLPAELREPATQLSLAIVRNRGRA